MDDEIIKLYKSKVSGPLIAKRLNIGLSFVYRVLKRKNISRRNASEQNCIRFEQSPLSYSIKEKLTDTEKVLKISGIMLYYGEGAKTGNTVDFANSDPVMLKIFIEFLRKICRVNENRLRFYLYCFSDQNPEKLIRYWSKFLNVRRTSFTKPYVKSTVVSDRKMQKGLLHIRYSDKKLLDDISKLNKEIVSSLKI